MPLHPEQHPLPLAQQQALKELLSGPVFRTLKSVVESKADTILASAVESAYVANQGDAMLLQADKQVQEAVRYRHCLEVLAELQKEEKDFTEVRINTSKPKPTNPTK
jgi:hypothetical protein